MSETAVDMFSMEAIGERIRTQDNQLTAHPMFLVEQRRRIYGIDTDYDPSIAWLHEDEAVEVDADTATKLEAQYRQDLNDSPEGYRRVGYHEQWQLVTCCFTQAAADLYITQNAHRFRELRVYVDSGYRNHEWIAVRDMLLRGAE